MFNPIVKLALAMSFAMTTTSFANTSPDQPVKPLTIEDVANSRPESSLDKVVKQISEEATVLQKINHGIEQAQKNGVSLTAKEINAIIAGAILGSGIGAYVSTKKKTSAHKTGEKGKPDTYTKKTYTPLQRLASIGGGLVIGAAIVSISIATSQVSEKVLTEESINNIKEALTTGTRNAITLLQQLGEQTSGLVKELTKDIGVNYDKHIRDNSAYSKGQ